MSDESSSTLTTGTSRTVKEYLKEETSRHSPESTSRARCSSLRKEDGKCGRRPASNKPISGYSRRSIPKRITRTLSKITFKSPSSRYSKLSDSSDQSAFEDFDASCGLEEHRKHRGSSSRRPPPGLKRSSSSKTPTVQKKKGPASPKPTSTVHNAAVRRSSSTVELSSDIDVPLTTPGKSSPGDSPTSSKRTSSLPGTPKHGSKRTSETNRKAVQLQSESPQSVGSSASHRPLLLKSSTPRKQHEASKTISTLQTDVSQKSTTIPVSATHSKPSSSRRQLTSKQETRIPPKSSGKIGLAIISSERAKTRHRKPKRLTAVAQGLPRGTSHAPNTRPSSSNHKASAGPNVRRVHVHHHHVVVSPACRGVVVHRHPTSRPPPPVVCPICRCDIKATVYSRLGCCFDCGSQHTYCSVSSEDGW